MNRKPFVYLFLTIVTFICSLDSYAQSTELRQLIQSGRSAYEKDDFETSLRLFQQANSLRPDHPMITRLLARLNALTSRKKEAYRSLQALMLIDADVEFLLHRDLQAIQGDDSFKEVQRAFDQMNKVEGILDTVAVVDSRKLHPESVVVLPNSDDILLGSVHEKRIVKILKNGEVEDWVSSGEYGLYSVMGMKVDAQRNLLWVASSAIPQMVWYTDELSGKAAVFAFDLDTKALVKKYEPKGTGSYWFGDLTLDEKGNVYITNSQTPEIFRITSIDGELEQWRFFPDLVSLQGLTAVENRLFFADYIHGVFSVVLNGESVTPERVVYPKNTSMKGIDGLYASNGQLITIQNGVYPNRISTWTISTDQKSVTSMKFLDKANPLFGEPTLGYVYENDFYYIANSQWNGYQSDGTIFKDEQLEDVYILKTTLKP